MGLMKILLGYLWGIWWWRTCDETTVVGDCLSAVADTSDRASDLGVLKVGGAKELLRAGWERGIPGDVPLDVVVSPGDTHRTAKSVVRHPASLPLGLGSLCKIGHGEYVFTPEMCFYQVASVSVTTLKGKVDARVRIVAVILLGLELCGCYSLSTSKRGFFDRKPLTSVSRLVRTAFELSSCYGISRMREALPWILDGSRSPKESQLYLILCLPAELGGFGLPKPELNHTIDVGRISDGFFAHREICTVDFYWAFARLVVEYDSKAFHADLGTDKVQRDDARADALRELGYDVVTITHDDLFDEQRLHAKAEGIAQRLGVELPPSTEEYLDMHQQLVNMLLRHDRWF